MGEHLWARDKPVELLVRQTDRSRVGITGPLEAARLQTPRSQPHPRAVVDQHFEPVDPAVSEHIDVVGTVPIWGDDGAQVLLCKRNIEPRKGKWTLPAGYMELGV
jgi:hypothetical protein